MKQELIHTPGGIPLLVLKNEALHAFALSVTLKAGSIYETPETNGYSHLLEHMLYRHLSAHFGENVDVWLERRTLASSAFTCKNSVYFRFSGMPEGLSSACEVLAALFLPLSLPREAFEAEKAVVKAEIREADERRSPAYAIEKRVWTGSPAVQTILGLCRSIDAATPEKLERFKRGLLTRENVFLCLSGRVDAQTVRRVSEAADSIPFYPEARPLSNRVSVPNAFFHRTGRVFTREWRASEIHFAFDLDYTKLGHLAADAVSRVLFEGMSALMDLQLRDKKHLVYAVDDVTDEYENAGSLRFSFETDPARTLSAVAATVETLNMLKRGEFDFDVYLRRELTIETLMLDDVYSANERLSYDAFLCPSLPPIDFDAPLLGRYAGITKEAIVLAANEIFRPENMTVLLAGKKPTPERVLRLIRAALAGLA